MKDIIEIANETCKYTIIQKEIPYKRKGYILLKQISGENYLNILETAANQLINSGATKIFFSCTDKNVTVPNTTIKTDNFAFHFHGDMDYLEKELSEFNNLADKNSLSFQNLSDENRSSFLHIYNECFLNVPNSATYTDDDVNQLMNAEHHSKAGVVCKKNEMIGIYEISFEGETPEIASVGIVKEKRGGGLGRQTLDMLLDYLYHINYKKVGLKVSTANPNAYNLYINTGFTKICTLSRWYLLDIENA